ncbi:hypothetical protein MPC4_100025 [Methylocella tundrae]|uniref:Uncharacterized protein n=1 Tax=Methylocella tundrae TaxID=227605 RepID=A0A8B6M380_METTU|nr:hypothetical protein MPC4_100025 [Methylocella tundrae]
MQFPIRVGNRIQEDFLNKRLAQECHDITAHQSGRRPVNAPIAGRNRRRGVFSFEGSGVACVKILRALIERAAFSKVRRHLVLLARDRTSHDADCHPMFSSEPS